MFLFSQGKYKLFRVDLQSKTGAVFDIVPGAGGDASPAF